MKSGNKTVGVIFNDAFSLLKTNYGFFVAVSAFLVLCACILAGVFCVIQAALFLPAGFGGAIPFARLFIDYRFYGDPALQPVVAGVLVALAVAAVLVLLYLFLLALSMLLSVALQTVTVSAQEAALWVCAGRKPHVDDVFRGFGRNWKRYLGVSAWTTLWVFLWTLLFWVPGVIKSYSYLLAPYLVIEYPDLTVREALKKSMEITDGYKGRLFGLSMIAAGFAVLSLLLCCLVVVPLAAALLWVAPLSLAMFALAYIDIRDAAVEKGLLPPAGGGQDGAGTVLGDSSDQPQPEAEDVPMDAGSGGGVEGQFVDLEEDSPQL